MKRFILKTVLMCCLALTSRDYCEDEPEVIDNSYLAGNYVLTSWTTPSPVDLDRNGIASPNLMEETDCFAYTAITIYENKTYTLTQHSLVIDGKDFRCESEITSGNWSRTGLTVTASDTSNTQTNYTFMANSHNRHTLICNIANGAYPDIAEDGSAIYASGDLELAYVRE